MFDVRKFLALGRRDKVMVLRMIGAHFDPRASPSFTLSGSVSLESP